MARSRPNHSGRDPRVRSEDLAASGPDRREGVSRCRAANEAERDGALRLILAEPGQALADHGALVSFKSWARRGHLPLDRIMVAYEGGELAHACMFVPQAGRCGSLWTALAPASGLALGVENLNELCGWAAREQVGLLQGLFETDDVGRHRLVKAAGFRRLTELIYLARSTRVGGGEVELPEGYGWLRYNESRREQFRATIEGTYVESLDCPELSSLRTAEQALESHFAAGEFRPEWWHLLVRGEEAVGAVLLSGLSDGQSMELSYMGLTPSGRGRGLGHRLVAKALQTAGAAGRPILTLAVDARNDPALKLYRRHNFTPLLRRVVFLRGLGG